jgi:hypothetical protein
VYIIRFIFRPLIVAPLSELYGYTVILHTANILFFIFNIAYTISTNLPIFIVFRLLVGLITCRPLTLGGGFIADLMAAERRARALTILDNGGPPEFCTRTLYNSQSNLCITPHSTTQQESRHFPDGGLSILYTTHPFSNT